MQEARVCVFVRTMQSKLAAKAAHCLRVWEDDGCGGIFAPPVLLGSPADGHEYIPPQRPHQKLELCVWLPPRFQLFETVLILRSLIANS